MYVVRKENGSCGTKRLHRNHLLPVNHLPIHLPPAGKHRVADREPKQCKVRTEGRMPSTDAEEEDSDAESDSSNGEWMGVSGTGDPASGEVTEAGMGNGESEAATDPSSVNKLFRRIIWG